MKYQVGNKCSECEQPHYGKGLCKFHYCKQWKEKHKTRHAELNRRSAKKHAASESTRKKLYRQLHKASERWKNNARQALRRARRRNATPAWADLSLIKLIYQSCPTGYHVDHIYPLRSPQVCGLHVAENLQYLPAVENLRKFNHMP